MAEPEPESQGALDLPAVHVLGPDWAETDCPISVRELTTRLRAAGAAGARPSWSAYIPPAKASDALPVDDLVDMDVVDEMDELDEEEAEELAMQVLSSLEDKAKAAVLEAPGTGKQRKHPITALSWCTLSAEEGRWTSELRAAAAAEGAPPPAAELAKGLSIFELAQYAIVSKGDAGVGLKRLEAVAALQKEYGWERLSPEESMAWCEEKFPGCWLASGNDAMGRPAMGSDIENYVPSFSTAEDWSLLMRVCIDMMDAMTCDLDDVRAGCIFTAQCKNMGWKNYNQEAEEKMAALYQDAYPIKFKAMAMVDAPLMIWAMMKLVSLFIKKKLRDRMFIVTTAQLLASGLFASPADIPKNCGGTFEGDYSTWLQERLARRAKAIAAVQLP